MPIIQFVKYLIYAISTSIAIFFILDFVIPLTQHIDLLWLSLVCFVSLAVLIFLFVEQSMRRSGGKGMISIVILNVLLKLIFSFGFVAIYVHYHQPQEKTFIIPFLTTYLVFTVFETWFLNKQAGSAM